jgi:hypothetical protein
MACLIFNEFETIIFLDKISQYKTCMHYLKFF